MEAYRLYNVVPALFEFIEELTNWYIRLNRSRFWAEGQSDDKNAAYQTLFTTLYELSVSMAPFTPFLSETIYQSLRRYLPDSEPESVHLCAYPEADESSIQPLLEQAVSRMQHIILLGRQKRNQEKVKTKYPLANLTVVHKDQALLDEISRLESYLSSELNVKSVTYDQNESAYIDFYGKPNSPILGKRFGKAFKDVKESIEHLSAAELEIFQDEGELVINGETFSGEDILVFREAKPGTDALSDKFISIDLSCALNDELVLEGRAREVVNRVQKSRKDLGLNVTDRIVINLEADDDLASAVSAHEAYIKGETLADAIESGIAGDGANTFAFEIDDKPIKFSIHKA
jgi:isoleucyl-tRNA synthetase